MEVVDRENFGPWKLWTVGALDRLVHGISQQRKPWTVEALGSGNPGLWKLWAVEALDCLHFGSSEQWKPRKL